MRREGHATAGAEAQALDSGTVCVFPAGWPPGVGQRGPGAAVQEGPVACAEAGAPGSQAAPGAAVESSAAPGRPPFYHRSAS